MQFDARGDKRRYVQTHRVPFSFHRHWTFISIMPDCALKLAFDSVEWGTTTTTMRNVNSSEMKYLHSFISSGGKCEEFKVNFNPPYSSTSIMCERLQSTDSTLFSPMRCADCNSSHTKLCTFPRRQRWCAETGERIVVALLHFRDGLRIDVNAISHTASETGPIECDGQDLESLIKCNCNCISPSRNPLPICLDSAKLYFIVAHDDKKYCSKILDELTCECKCPSRVNNSHKFDENNNSGQQSGEL